MSGLINKFKDWVGINPEIDEDEEFYDELFGAANQYDDEIHETAKTKKTKLNVVSHPAKTGAYEVVVTEPKTFEDSLDIVNSLRERKSIILNLHLLDAEQSQRVVDFVSGATHAVDGHQQRIGEGVFIFTPNNVNISAETEKAKVLKEAFWNKA